MKKIFSTLILVFLSIFIFFYTLQISNYSQKLPREPKTYVTMSLCWGENAQELGKEKFPYSEALIFSTQLWHKLTPGEHFFGSFLFRIVNYVHF